MAETSAFASVSGGLGLFLIGLWLYTEGMTASGGSILCARLESWTRDRRRAFATGLATAVACPAGYTATRASMGIASSGLVRFREALWVLVGGSLGGVVAAWLVAAIAGREAISGVGLVLLALGTATVWSGPATVRLDWGKAVIGLGTLLFGLSVLDRSFAVLGVSIPLHRMGLDGFLLSALCVLLGVGLVAVLRSPSAVVALILVAAGGQALDLLSAAALLIGANLGASLGVVRTLREGTPTARRTALAHVALHSASAVLGLMLVVTLAPIANRASGAGESPLLALTVLQTLMVGAGVLAFGLTTRFVIPLLEARFVDQQSDARRSGRIDAAALALPDLALEALIREVEEIGDLARSISSRVLASRKLSTFRRVHDLAAVHAKAEAADAFAAELSRDRLSRTVSDAVVEIPRASRSFRQLADLLVAYEGRDRVAEQRVDTALGSRLRQLEAAVQHLVEGTAPFGAEFSPAQCEGELGAVQGHARELTLRLLAQLEEGRLASHEVALLLERCHTLRRIARAAIRAMASLARTRYPELLLVEELPSPGSSQPVVVDLERPTAVAA